MHRQPAQATRDQPNGHRMQVRSKCCPDAMIRICAIHGPHLSRASGNRVSHSIAFDGNSETDGISLLSSLYPIYIFDAVCLHRKMVCEYIHPSIICGNVIFIISIALFPTMKREMNGISLRFQRVTSKMAIPEFVNKICVIIYYSALCISCSSVFDGFWVRFGSVQSVSHHVAMADDGSSVPLPLFSIFLYPRLCVLCKARDIIVGTPMIIDCISHFIINIIIMIAIRTQRNERYGIEMGDR